MAVSKEIPSGLGNHAKVMSHASLASVAAAARLQHVQQAMTQQDERLAL